MIDRWDSDNGAEGGDTIRGALSKKANSQGDSNAWQDRQVQIKIS
jgi:hypothetical protein